MARDFALLFPPVHRSPHEALVEVLPLLTPIGVAYRAIATRMDFSSEEDFWRLSTTSESAKSLEEIAAQLRSWDGIALELQSKFGPMKLMAWKHAAGGSGFGLFETSAVFTAQAEDPDVCDVFESIALGICDATGCDAFVLVGDPGIRAMARDEILGCIAKSPRPTAEPLVYTAGVRVESAYSSVVLAAPEWHGLSRDPFLVFRSPGFGVVPTDE